MKQPQSIGMPGKVLMYLVAIIFGIIALVAPGVAYQLLGAVIGLLGLVYGGLIAYRLLRMLKQQPTLSHDKIAIFIGLIVLGIFLLLIPVTILKQTVGIALVIALLSVGFYQLYFLRKQYINPLTWKNYLLGGGALLTAVIVVIFLDQTSDWIMMLIGVLAIGYSTYQLLTLYSKRG